MFDPVPRLLLGLATGFVFGFLLQKGGVAKHSVIIGQLLLRDWTVAKIIGAAIVVGAAGVYALHAAGVVPLDVKAVALGSVIVGGVLFGIGMAVLGYCPGTSVAACAEGRRDAVAGVLGMLAGAGLFVITYPYVSTPLGRVTPLGPDTLPERTGVSPWLWIAALAVAGLLVVGVPRLRRRAPAGRAAHTAT